MVISQGDVCWANLREPEGSEAGYRRPVLVVQGDPLNKSRLATVICVPLASNLRLAAAPGNVLLKAKGTGLSVDSVANVSQVVAIDRLALEPRVGRLSRPQLDLVFAGLDVVLDRTG